MRLLPAGTILLLSGGHLEFTLGPSVPDRCRHVGMEPVQVGRCDQGKWRLAPGKMKGADTSCLSWAAVKRWLTNVWERGTGEVNLSGGGSHCRQDQPSGGQPLGGRGYYEPGTHQQFGKLSHDNIQPLNSHRHPLLPRPWPPSDVPVSNFSL